MRMKFLVIIGVGIFNFLSGLAQSDKDSLFKHVVKLSTFPYARNFYHLEYLNKSATYIHDNFSLHCPRVFRQKFIVDKQIVQNIIASFGPEQAPRIIIGAHYDVFGEAPGADNNASGVAGLLELSRLLSKIDKNLLYRIDLVAYTLKEPPFFNTKDMGSYHHALSLKENQVEVIGMINLQSIGYFTDRPKSQRYPFFINRWLYGHRGNFIAVIQKNGQGNWPNRMNYLFKQYIQGLRLIQVKPWITFKGLYQSDHKNFWDMDIPAIVITNTGYFRNKNYHRDTDTYETLDYFRMAKVIDMIFKSVVHFRP